MRQQTGHSQVVGHDHHCQLHLPRELPKHVQQPRLHRDVKTRSGLVHEHQARAGHQITGNLQSLSHAPRKGARCVVDVMVQIGAGSVLGADVKVGASSVIHPRVAIYDGVQIGARVIVHSGAVLGADGFGFAPDPSLAKGAWGKIPQLGGLVIGNDVEIGANTTIDRGALENTVIEDGVKLDNQIMIAHNCRIGTHTAIAACTAVAGSTTIGARCTIAGAAGIAGHLTICDDVFVSGGTGITTDVTEPGRYTGVFPFAPHAEWQRNAAVVSQLSTMRKRLRKLERE